MLPQTSSVLKRKFKLVFVWEYVKNGKSIPRPAFDQLNHAAARMALILIEQHIISYCLTKCLYMKSCNLNGWIAECGPSYIFVWTVQTIYTAWITVKRPVQEESAGEASEDHEMLLVWKIVSKFLEKLKMRDCYIFDRALNQFIFSINFLKFSYTYSGSQEC